MGMRVDGEHVLPVLGGGAIGVWAYMPGRLAVSGVVCSACGWFGWLVGFCIVVRVSVMQVFCSCFSVCSSGVTVCWLFFGAFGGCLGTRGR